jgi:hypothetical protein
MFSYVEYYNKYACYCLTFHSLAEFSKTHSSRVACYNELKNTVFSLCNHHQIVSYFFRVAIYIVFERVDGCHVHVQKRSACKTEGKENW